MKFCAACGTPLELAADFCSDCGAPVAPSTAAPVPEPLPAWPPRPAPAHSETTVILQHPWPALAPPPHGASSLAAAQPWPDADEQPAPRRPRGRDVVLAVAIAAALLLGAAAAAITGLTGPKAKTKAVGSPAATRTQSSTPSPTSSIEPTPAGSAAPLTAPHQLAGSASVDVPTTAASSRDSGGNITTYGSGNLVDGQLATAWRMAGDGAGSDLTISLPAPATLTRVGLVNGYSKRDPVTAVDRYRQERRILSVTWQFSNGTALTQPLRDGDHGLQTLAVRNITADKVTLHIDATTAPGDARFDYTAISEPNITGG